MPASSMARNCRHPMVLHTGAYRGEPYFRLRQRCYLKVFGRWFPLPPPEFVEERLAVSLNGVKISAAQCE
jgi:hypothetical protein